MEYQIYLNGENTLIPEGTSLYKTLEIVGMKEFQGLAVAVNGKVIPKKSWSETLLNDKDKVLLVTAVQGG
jgi:sulfur carrier protein